MKAPLLPDSNKQQVLSRRAGCAQACPSGAASTCFRGLGYTEKAKVGYGLHSWRLGFSLGVIRVLLFESLLDEEGVSSGGA